MNIYGNLKEKVQSLGGHAFSRDSNLVVFCFPSRTDAEDFADWHGTGATVIGSTVEVAVPAGGNAQGSTS